MKTIVKNQIEKIRNYSTKELLQDFEISKYCQMILIHKIEDAIAECLELKERGEVEYVDDAAEEKLGYDKLTLDEQIVLHKLVLYIMEELGIIDLSLLEEE